MKRVRGKDLKKDAPLPQKKIFNGQPISIGDSNEVQVFVCDKSSVAKRRYDAKLNFIAQNFGDISEGILHLTKNYSSEVATKCRQDGVQEDTDMSAGNSTK